MQANDRCLHRLSGKSNRTQPGTTHVSFSAALSPGAEDEVLAVLCMAARSSESAELGMAVSCVLGCQALNRAAQSLASDCLPLM